MRPPRRALAGLFLASTYNCINCSISAGIDSARQAFDGVICNRVENESSSVFITGCPSSNNLRRISVSNASSIATSASGSTQRTRDQSFVKRTTELSGRPASRSSTPIFTNSFFTASGIYRTRKNSHGWRSFTLVRSHSSLKSSTYPLVLKYQPTLPARLPDHRPMAAPETVPCQSFPRASPNSETEPENIPETRRLTPAPVPAVSPAAPPAPRWLAHRCRTTPAEPSRQFPRSSAPPVPQSGSTTVPGSTIQSRLCRRRYGQTRRATEHPG